jgi:hypothetical protein
VIGFDAVSGPSSWWRTGQLDDDENNAGLTINSVTLDVTAPKSFDDCMVYWVKTSTGMT